MEESKLPEEFSLIEKYNLKNRIRTQQSEYPICWAHALAEMITDSVQIYKFNESKSNMPSSKRRKIDYTTYINPKTLDYVYTTSLIWITSHYGFTRKKFDFLFDTQTYVSSEKCYPFEQTIFKLVNDNPSTSKYIYDNLKDPIFRENSKYESAVTNLLQPPYFQNMDKMKDKYEISYIDRCKYDKYDDKLYEPEERDNELYVNFIFKPYVDKMYSILFTNSFCSMGLFNNPEIILDWKKMEKNQINMKELLSCNNKIIKAGFTLNFSIFEKFITALNKNYENANYFDFDKYVEPDEEDEDEYIPVHNEYSKEIMVFHKILIYGWVNNGDREYWIIRDSFFPKKEYYFPIAKKDDKFFLGLELKYGIIDIELSDYLKEKIDKNVENVENVESSIFER